MAIPCILRVLTARFTSLCVSWLSKSGRTAPDLRRGGSWGLIFSLDVLVFAVEAHTHILVPSSQYLDIEHLL